MDARENIVRHTCCRVTCAICINGWLVCRVSFTATGDGAAAARTTLGTSTPLSGIWPIRVARAPF